MKIEAPPSANDPEALEIWLRQLWERISREDIAGSVTWNPGSISDGDEEATDVTITGAELGDYAIASFSLDVSDLQLTADVTAANTVTAVLSNSTGGAVDLAEGTLYVRLLKRTT